VSSRTLHLDDQGRLLTLDQTRLPFEEVWIELADEAGCAHAIRTMQVRGAPLIGAVGAYGLALAVKADPSDAALAAACARLEATRPTAVNLRWALERVAARVRAVAPAAGAERAALAWREAGAICDEDVAANRAIGEHAIGLLAPQIARAQAEHRPLRLLTHCNAGAIATVAWGTALAPMFLLHARGQPLQVWVDETRPRNQGASLTAWELNRAGIAHTLVADNAGGLLMMRGQVDAVIVGCDRVAANGDVANKVGTYLKALAAQAHGVPFLVACPVSTLDPRIVDGASIPIEDRDAREVTHLRGRAADGRLLEVQIAPDGTPAANPAFDVTPAALVTALVTERGPCAASVAGLRAHCPDLFGH
jgi:methylthioribose-1-phosphate isomerase